MFNYSMYGIYASTVAAMLALGPATITGRESALEPSGFDGSAAMTLSGAAPDLASVTLLLLGKLGVDFSGPEAEIKQWLANRQFTPYPALADALLLLLDGKRLRQPVDLKVIVWNYEHAPGVSSPRDVSQVDFATLRAAVVEAYNTRHGEAIRDFQSLLQ